MIVNNWQIIMFAFASLYGQGACLYFMIYYVLTMIVITVVVAFILEAFLFRMQITSRRKLQKEHKRDIQQTSTFMNYELLRTITGNVVNSSNTIQMQNTNRAEASPDDSGVFNLHSLVMCNAFQM
jgi:hypothetical protein